MTEPTDLITWLPAVLDEDETATRDLLYWVQQTILTLKDPKLLGKFIPGWHDWPKVEQMCIDRLADIEAKRRILDEWQQGADKYVAYLNRSDAELHADFAHPDYEYATTEGQRKAFYDADVPPEGDGWERNVDAGDDGWERLDYTEESYWRRPRPDGQRGRREPEPPSHIKLLTLPYADREGYREEWRP